MICSSRVPSTIAQREPETSPSTPGHQADGLLDDRVRNEGRGPAGNTDPVVASGPRTRYRAAQRGLRRTRQRLPRCPAGHRKAIRPQRGPGRAPATSGGELSEAGNGCPRSTRAGPNPATARPAGSADNMPVDRTTRAGAQPWQRPACRYRFRSAAVSAQRGPGPYPATTP
jgi:hypothetical protein